MAIQDDPVWMAHTLRDIRTMIDMGLRGKCMREDCTRDAEFQIRALDIGLALHDHPVLLCKKCLRSRLNVDMTRWNEKYQARLDD